MLSKYFKIKTNSKDFNEYLSTLIGELKDKKVLLYGAGRCFVELNKKYSFADSLNVVAIADKKFEKGKNLKSFASIKPIAPSDILKEEYDVILVTNESPLPILKYLKNQLDIQDKEIRHIFNEEIRDEAANTNYLYQFKFEKTLPKLVKKLKGKSVILYGAGSFLELINRDYDLSGLNILGVADKRFSKHEENEKWLGYKVYSIDEMKDANPDYVLVATKFYVNIIEDLYYDTLNGTNIKVKPLLRKSFFTLVKEIWG